MDNDKDMAELRRQIEERRNDPEFMARLRKNVEEHRELLDRLADT